jgi:diacylglycerol kinase family enzyme
MACITHLKFGFSAPALLHRSCATRVTLTTSKPRAVNADGEIQTQTPAEFSLRRQGLTVIVPRTLPAGHQGLSQMQEEATPALAP